jgi:hypothetical protein
VVFAASAQETLYKSAYSGGYLVVPKSESWKIDRVFINDGAAYSIQVANSNFKKQYHSGDTIRAPYYIAEMELLSNKEMVQYQFYFKQK